MATPSICTIDKQGRVGQTADDDGVHVVCCLIFVVINDD